MDPSAVVAGEQRISGDDGLLGHPGPAAQAEPRGGLPFMCHGTFGQAWFLAVFGDEDAEVSGVFNGPSHELRVGDAPAVVGEHAHLRP